MKEFDIKIDFNLRILPRTPYKSTCEELHIRQAELWVQSNVHKLISALEDKLNDEFNPYDVVDFGIKKIDLTPRKV